MAMYNLVFNAVNHGYVTSATANRLVRLASLSIRARISAVEEEVSWWKDLT
jgi:hypothetical protein